MIQLPLLHDNPSPPPRNPQPFSQHTLSKHSRLQNATLTHSVCPYCAVGCATNVYTKDGTVIDIEGNPQSPINQGTLCPKGANIYQLGTNPHRVKQVLHRKPRSAEWEVVDRDWALSRVAQLVKESRDKGYQKTTKDGQYFNAVTNIGSLGGATLDNEENYLMKKLFSGALQILSIENQARI